MKIQLLNKNISQNNILNVLFPFEPIALPILKNGKISTEDNAESIHYSSIIYSIKDNDFRLFEFGKDIMDGLVAYRIRHGSMLNVEILLSREENGTLRITSGNTNVPFGIVGKDLYNKYLEHNDNLFSKYMSKIGRIVHDVPKF